MKVSIESLDAHRGGRPVIRGVSISVPSGTVLGLLGPNGSGKSTLLRSAAGIDVPSAGQIRYDGTDITTLRRKELAKRVAVMTQEHSEEFEVPVLELVLLGRIPHGRGFGRDSERDIEIARDALERTGAGHLIDRSFSALSGGERQRVLFARALTQDTPVLVLDEPTNHLDIAHQLELLDLVQASERTVLIALHDLNLAARSCDALGVLDNGQLVAHGTPDEILDTEIIRSVFGVEATAVSHPRSGQQHFLFDSRGPHRDQEDRAGHLNSAQEGITT